MKNLNIKLPALPYMMEEAFKKLKINFQFVGNDTKKILITSSIPNEGKSFVAVQLWQMLAESGSKTMFLDLDMRNSVLIKRLNMEFEEENPVGIDYYLSGQCEYEDVIYKTNVEHGDFIPCINLLENPTSLIEDHRFEELLERLSKEYRYIIIDSAPLAAAADANVIATMSDGAVFVVRNEYTSRKLIRTSMQQLEQIHCKLLGVVLNRESVSSKSYGKYGYYGYDGYYGGDREDK